MLQKLSIQNYAIIEALTVQFAPDLNIITGETGAGKSILIGALGLVLGDRADSQILLSKDKKCVVEAVFLLKDEAALTYLRENDLDVEDSTIVRREIAVNGKSRAFINDSPVTISQLKQFATILVDLHQQFDTLEVGDALFQIQVLDALAGNAATLSTYQKDYDEYAALQKQLKQIVEETAVLQKEQDYYQFLYDELGTAGFVENELEDLDQELKTLANAEQIKSFLGKFNYALQEGEQPIVPFLKSMGNQLTQLQQFHQQLPVLAERVASLQVELQDIADDLDSLNDKIGVDTKRLDWVNERVNLGYKLLKKHNVSNTAALLQFKDEIEKKLQVVADASESISTLENKIKQKYATLEKQAGILSKARKAKVAPIEQQLDELLTQVGMPNARVKIDIQACTINRNGADDVSFLFDANKSNRFEPLKKVASGGELSRLMLCIKSIVAKSVALPTLIFDEIDTGISGEAAKQVGIIMKALGKAHQVISITHQPQIAAMANAHYFIYKKEAGNQITTNIKLLSNEERTTAIAQMLSGEKPTQVALENAREMIAKS